VGEGNFFPAQVLGVDGEQVRVRISVGGSSIESKAASAPGAAGTGVVLIRPESVRMGPSTPDSRLTGAVRRVEFQGAITQYELESNGAGVRVHALSKAGRYDVGETVDVSWHDGECVFFPEKGAGLNDKRPDGPEARAKESAGGNLMTNARVDRQ
jgi:ABC-type Fe3+/spermidine/putrescine transport system ATPase subunit